MTSMVSCQPKPGYRHLHKLYGTSSLLLISRSVCAFFFYAYIRPRIPPPPSPGNYPYVADDIQVDRFTALLSKEL